MDHNLNRYDSELRFRAGGSGQVFSNLVKAATAE
jgi:hypothetical protein